MSSHAHGQVRVPAIHTLDLIRELDDCVVVVGGGTDRDKGEGGKGGARRGEKRRREVVGKQSW